jgi:hypothetical protein
MSVLTVPFDRLTRLARAMEIITTIGIALVIAGMVACFLIPDWTRNLLLAKLGQVGAALPITPPARIAAACAVALPVVVMVYGLFAVRALFRECAQGRALTVRAAHHLQVFAASVALQAPLGPLTSALLSVVVSMADPSGQRLSAITFSLHDYYALIIGGALFAAATVLREAARLADENATFV